MCDARRGEKPGGSPASSVAGPAANRQARSRDSSRCRGRLVYQPPGNPIRLPENVPTAAALRRARKIPAFWCCRTTPQRPLPLAVFFTIRAAGPKCRALPSPEARLLPSRARLRIARREAGILRAAAAGWCTNRLETRYACLRTFPPPRLSGVPEKSRHSGAAARHRNDRCHWRSSSPSGPPVPNAGLCRHPKPGFFRRGPGCESPGAKPGFFALPRPAGVPTAWKPDTPA